MAVVRNLMVRAGADFTALTRGLRQAQGQVQNFQSRVTTAMNGVAAALAAVGVGLTLGQAIKDAVKVEGALISLNVLLGESADDFIHWANSSAHAFGMSKTEAIDYGKTYANLLSGFASSNKETLTMTQDLLKASAVIASMSGREMTDVMERIRSGMLGNTEAIEDLGIYVNVAMIESTEAFKKFANGKSWEQLSFKIQQQIRYFAILEQSNKKFGTELADTTGLKIAQFTASLGNLRLALGNAFLPILSVVLPSLTRMVNGLAKAMEYVAAFSRALFGQKKQAQDMSKQSAAVSGVGEAYKESGEAAKAAAKAQKGFLSGFDEVNTVSMPKADASATEEAVANAAVPVPELDTADMNAELDKVAAAAEAMGARVRQAFQNMTKVITDNKELIISALAGIAGAFLIFKSGAIFSGVATAISSIGGALAILASPILWIGLLIAGLVAAFVYFYRTNETFRGVVDGIFNAIGDSLKFVWEKVLKPVGAFLKDVFVVAWDAVSVAARWFYNNVIKPLGDYLLIFYNEVIEPLAVLLADVFALAFQIVADVAKSFWENTLKPVAKKLTEVFKPAVEAVSAVLKFLWESIIKPLAKLVGDILLGAFKSLVSVLTNLWKNVLSPFITFMKDVFLLIFDEVFTAIGGYLSGAIDAFKGVLNFITGVFTGDWQKAWNGVKEIFGGIFDSLVSLVKAPINIIISMINKLIEGLNGIGIDLPEWMGGGKFNFNLPKIPKLAQGGIVSSPTLAMVGEAGPEMIVPLEDTSFVDKLASAVGTAVLSASQLSGGMNSQQQSKDVVVQIDGNTLARVLNPFTIKEAGRTGNSLITVR
jgi:phage-related protein